LPPTFLTISVSKSASGYIDQHNLIRVTAGFTLVPPWSSDESVAPPLVPPSPEMPPEDRRKLTERRRGFRRGGKGSLAERLAHGMPPGGSLDLGTSKHGRLSLFPFPPMAPLPQEAVPVRHSAALPLFAVVPFLRSSEAASLYEAFGEPIEQMPLVHLVDPPNDLLLTWQDLQLLQTLSVQEDQLINFNYCTLPSLTSITIWPSYGSESKLDLCPTLGRFLTPKLKILNLKGFCCDTI
ncbi:hypothetical protein FOZ62_001953, partial [Perkinsus olseni]